MPNKLIVFSIVSFVHDLCTAVWIGGLFTLGLTVLPSIKQVLGKGPQTKKLIATIQKKLSTWVYVSIILFAISGILMSQRSPQFLGLFHFGNSYANVLAIKHILILVMIGVALYRSLVLGKKQAMQPSDEKLNAILLFTNIIAGVLVLLLSGFLTALSSGVPPAM